MFIGVGIFRRLPDGSVRMPMAYDTPWRNNLEVRQWVNSGYGVAGTHGLYTRVLDGSKIVFTLIEAGQRAEYGEVFLGPHAFRGLTNVRL